MKYYFSFKDIDNRNNYSVELLPYGDQSIIFEVLNPAVSPFVVKSDSELFGPLITSGATISIVEKKIIMDLYTSDPHGVQVLLKNNNTVVWRGYLTENAYTQEYNDVLAEMQLEAVCQLSTLSNYRFDRPYSKMMSVTDIIRKCVIVSGGGYENIYIQEHVKESSGSAGFCLDRIYIQNSNWYDENSDAMTYKEVLEEILTYYQLSMKAIGNNIYISDIKCKSRNYMRYFGSNYDQSSMAVLSDLSMDIDNIDSRGTGNTLDIKGIVNKINVLSNFKSDSEFIPKFDKEKTIFINELTYNGVDGSQVGDKHTVKKRYYKDPKFIYHRYGSVSGGELTDDDLDIIDDYDSILGAQFVRIASWKNEDDDPNKLNFDDVLQCKIASVKTDIVTDYLNSNLPIFESKNSVYTAMQGCFISINFDLKMAYYAHSLSYGDKFDRDITIKAPCKLCIGDKYWSGSSWVGSSAIFYVDIVITKDSDRNSYVSVKDTNTYINKVPDLSGYVFPTPSDELLTGDIKFTLLPFLITDELAKKKAIYVFVKSFEIKYQFPSDAAYSGDWTDDTDILYSNIVSDSYETTDKDIKCKVTTYDSTGVSLSSPIIMSGNKYKYVDTHYWIHSTKSCIAEENIIDRYVTHFAYPKKSIKLIKSIIDLRTRYTKDNIEYNISGYEIDYQQCLGSFYFEEL